MGSSAGGNEESELSDAVLPVSGDSKSDIRNVSWREGES